MAPSATSHLPRAARLQAHFDAYAGAEVIWGTSDCTRWAANWAEAEIGRRLGLPRYTSEEEARALIAAAGGLLPLWERETAMAGVFQTRDPQLGDVGLIDTRLYGPIAVIVAHDGIVALRTSMSVTFLRPRRFLRAWSI
jgi:hypothetical protein